MKTSLKHRVAEGRRQIRQYHFWLILISAGTIIEYWLEIGTGQWVLQAAQFVLTIGLLGWVSTGSPFARLLTITLCWVGGAAMVMLAVRVYEADWFAGLCLGANALTFLLYTRALMWSETIKEFLDSQRSRTLI